MNDLNYDEPRRICLRKLTTALSRPQPEYRITIKARIACKRLAEGHEQNVGDLTRKSRQAEPQVQIIASRGGGVVHEACAGALRVKISRP